MISRATRGALFALPLAFMLCGCQTGENAPVIDTGMAATPLDGTWASNDGVFIATFEHGAFTSRFVKTNEILAQGSYTVSGNAVNLQWISVATQQQRAAACTINSSDSVSCTQEGGGSFDLNRTG